MVDFNRAVLNAIKTGKVVFGSKEAIKAAKTGKTKLLIIAANCPKGLREDIEYYARLSKVRVYIYPGSGIDLGVVCGKPFSISALSVREQGDSDILDLVKTTNVK